MPNLNFDTYFNPNFKPNLDSQNVLLTWPCCLKCPQKNSVHTTMGFFQNIDPTSTSKPVLHTHTDGGLLHWVDTVMRLEAQPDSKHTAGGEGGEVGGMMGVWSGGRLTLPSSITIITES